MQHLETHKESFISVNESLHVSDNSSYLDVKEESKSCRLVGFTKKKSDWTLLKCLFHYKTSLCTRFTRSECKRLDICNFQIPN